jgi:hypothetical protein
MEGLQKLQDLLDKYNVLYCDNPTFLWDIDKKKIVTEEENNSNVFFQQMGMYAFNTSQELEELLQDGTYVVIQKDSLGKSPWNFAKYKIRFKLLK